LCLSSAGTLHSSNVPSRMSLQKNCNNLEMMLKKIGKRAESLAEKNGHSQH
jgi:hypothetical protein